MEAEEVSGFDTGEQEQPQTAEEPVDFNAGEESTSVSEPAPSGETPTPASSPPPDYTARFEALERRNRELESSLRNLSDPNFRQQPRAPEFFSKPRQQWTEKDLIEYSDWRIEQGLQRASDDQRARGLYSEHTLGKGNDYDSVVNTYLAPLTRQNPEIAPFLQMLGPEDRYMLGLLHEVHAKSNGNLVQTIRAIRNAIGARTEGAKDVTKAIQNATKGAALKVVQGAGGRQTAQQPRTAQDVWNMSEDDFRAEVNRRS